MSYFGSADAVIRDYMPKDNKYTQDLQYFVRYVVAPVKEGRWDAEFCEAILENDDVNKLFELIINLENIHRHMNAELGPAAEVRDSGERKVAMMAEIIYKRKDQLVLYCKYWPAMRAANIHFREMRAKAEFRNTMRTIEEHLQYTCGNRISKVKQWTLGDFLEIPFDMLHTYQDFVMDLTHYGRPQILGEAIRLIREVLESSDKCELDVIAKLEIDELQSRIKKLPRINDTEVRLSDYGGIIRKGKLRVRYSDQLIAVDRYLLLLNRVIVILNPVFNPFQDSGEGDKYKYKDMIDLKEFSVLRWDVQSRNPLVVRFSLHQEGNSKDAKYWSFQCFSRRKKDQWTEDITSTLAKIHVYGQQENGHDFDLFTSEPGYRCDQSDLVVRGMTMQCYRCTNCSKVVLKESIQDVAPCNPNPLDEEWLSGYNWYVGRLSPEEAAEIFQSSVCTVGTFCVRHVTEENIVNYFLTIKLDSGILLDIPIRISRTNRFYLEHWKLEGEPVLFDCIPDLVHYYKMKPLRLSPPLEEGNVFTLGLGYHALVPREQLVTRL